jgi:hypothetical protein
MPHILKEKDNFKTLCGEKKNPFDFYYMDGNHALIAVKNGIAVCRKCLRIAKEKEVIKLKNNGIK